jgi:Homeodomain-like domain-containing protein
MAERSSLADCVGELVKCHNAASISSFAISQIFSMSPCKRCAALMTGILVPLAARRDAGPSANPSPNYLDMSSHRMKINQDSEAMKTSKPDQADREIDRRQAIAERMQAAPERKPHRLPRCRPKPFKAKPKPEGYIFGRPTVYDPSFSAEAIRFMSQGYSVTALAGHLLVSKETVYQWINRYPDFADAVNIGRSARVSALENKLLSTKMGVGVTAAIFALKNADPDEWKDLYNVQNDLRVTIEHVSDDQLLAIASKGIKTIEHEPNATG